MRLKTKIFLILFMIAVLSIGTFLWGFLKISYYDQLSYQHDEIINKTQFLSSLVKNRNGSLTPDIYYQFQLPSWIQSGLIDLDGKILASSSQLITFNNPEYLAKINHFSTSEGLFHDDKTKSIVAYSFVPGVNNIVLSIVSDQQIFRSKYLYFAKMLSFLLIISSLVWILGELSARYITRNIDYISHIIESYGAGNLKVRLSVTSSDEFGKLSTHFNIMADKIDSFIEKLKKTTRMEEELKTANRVQKYFFPSFDFKTDQCEISGHYQPASECGGDWWFHIQQNNKIYLMIGDVTGHGTASAMLTSSCRTAVSLIFNTHKDLETSEIATLMNKSIYETVNGDLNMTMFIACYNLTDGSFQYTNASHEFPLFWPLTGKKPTRKSIQLFSEVHGPRLGENKDQNYSSTKITLDSNVRILLYSDGLYDLQNDQGQILEERGLLKILFTSPESLSCNSFKNFLSSSFSNYHKNENLKDDISFLIFDILKQPLNRILTGT